MGILSRRREPAQPAAQPPATPAAQPPAYTPDAQRPVSATPPAAVVTPANLELPLYAAASISGKTGIGEIKKDVHSDKAKSLTLGQLVDYITSKEYASSDAELKFCAAFNGLESEGDAPGRELYGRYMVQLPGPNGAKKWYGQKEADKLRLTDFIKESGKEIGADGKLADVNKLAMVFNKPHRGGLYSLL